MDLTIDYETRSAIDLKTRGAFVYADSPTTEIMCLGLKVNREKPLLWVPQSVREKINPRNLRYELISAKERNELWSKADRFIAHNAQFEYVISHKVGPRYGIPPLKLSKLHCTMAQCGYHALPLSLDQAGLALNLPVQKDSHGHSVMLKLCKPRKARKAERERFEADGYVEQDDASWVHPGLGEKWYLWHEDPADLETLLNYCGRDVDTERLVFDTLAPLPEYERKIWLLDQKINLRGVPIDVESVKSIVDVVSEREEQQLDRFQKLTGGAVSGPRSYVALKDWVNQQTGLSLDSVDKNATAELLDGGLLSPHVAEVLKIKAELSKSSVAKFRAMLNHVSPDGFLRGMFMYAGASTLRWSGRAVQVHNLPRDSYHPEDYEAVLDLFKRGDLNGIGLLYDDPFFVASRCVRGSLCAKPGTTFICSDFSSIEAVVDAWLADDQFGLAIFRDGSDPYRVAAMTIFNMCYDEIKKSSPERQVGKCAVLALGFLGGIGAFVSMARNYGVDLETLPGYVMPHATQEELEGEWGARAMADRYLKRNPGSMSHAAAVACDVIKQKWRSDHFRIVEFGRALEKAAKEAILNPGTIQVVGRIKYCYHNRFLKCQLPSGRLIHYYLPRISKIEDDEGDVKSAITYMGLRVVDGKTTRQWTRLATYSGKLLENVVQGTARDLLAEAMLRLEAAGFPIHLHVHDEAAAIVSEGSRTLEEFDSIMAVLPKWAEGMPVKAKGWAGRRYRK